MESRITEFRVAACIMKQLSKGRTIRDTLIYGGLSTKAFTFTYACMMLWSSITVL